MGRQGRGAGTGGVAGAGRRPRASRLPGPALIDRFVSPFVRSEEHTSELQSLMRISYAVFCLKKKKKTNDKPTLTTVATQHNYIYYTVILFRPTQHCYNPTNS